jgi:hypothetical protein
VLKAECFSSAHTGLEAALLAGRPNRGMECHQSLWTSITGSSSIRRLKDCPVESGPGRAWPRLLREVSGEHVADATDAARGAGKKMSADQPRLDGPHCCLSAVVHGQFPEQVLDVLFHGLDADFERLGYLVVWQADGDAAKHLLLLG